MVHKTKTNKKKDNTICVGPHHMQANTNNTNKTWPSHKQLEANTNRTSLPCANHNGQHNTEPRTQRHTTGQHKKTKTIINTYPTKNRGWTQVLAKGKQFLLLIWHPPFYSYIQSSLVKVLAVIGERKHLRKK